MKNNHDSLPLDVRAADYERFLAIQLASAAKRPALYAVTAFAAELARIHVVVSEPLLGHIRLAWWREGLEEIAAGASPRKQPVMEALGQMHTTHPRVLPELQKIVAAHAMDFDEAALADDAARLAYVDATAGALHRAWALILDEAAADVHAEQIREAARGYAMQLTVNAKNLPRPLRLLARFSKLQREGLYKKNLNMCGVSRYRLVLVLITIQEIFF
jgi:phytoene/squalene synthetase